jgi:hypothetical protein
MSILGDPSHPHMYCQTKNKTQVLVHFTMDGKDDDHFTETGSAKRVNAEQRSVLTPKRKSVFEVPL